MPSARSPKLRELLLLEGAEGLSDAQLVALLLGTGTPGKPALQTATELLRLTGSLTLLTKLSAEVLAVSGIGPAKAARLFAGLELGRRAARARPAVMVVNDESDVADWAAPRLCDLEHEEVWVLCLDARQHLKATSKLAQGGLHSCALTPQDVLRPAVRNAASAIVLVHNHPSGDPTPSLQDLEMTRSLAKACELLGIPLLDHVVVANGGVRSIGALLSSRGQP